MQDTVNPRTTCPCAHKSTPDTKKSLEISPNSNAISDIKKWKEEKTTKTDLFLKILKNPKINKKDLKKEESLSLIKHFHSLIQESKSGKTLNSDDIKAASKIVAHELAKPEFRKRIGLENLFNPNEDAIQKIVLLALNGDKGSDSPDLKTIRDLLNPPVSSEQLPTYKSAVETKNTLLSTSNPDSPPPYETAIEKSSAKILIAKFPNEDQRGLRLTIRTLDEVRTTRDEQLKKLKFIEEKVGPTHKEMIKDAIKKEIALQEFSKQLLSKLEKATTDNELKIILEENLPILDSLFIDLAFTYQTFTLKTKEIEKNLEEHKTINPATWEKPKTDFTPNSLSVSGFQSLTRLLLLTKQVNNGLKEANMNSKEELETILSDVIKWTNNKEKWEVFKATVIKEFPALDKKEYNFELIIDGIFASKIIKDAGYNPEFQKVLEQKFKVVNFSLKALLTQAFQTKFIDDDSLSQTPKAKDTYTYGELKMKLEQMLPKSL
jgi:hypothetical protein